MMNQYLQVEKKSLFHKIDWRLVIIILLLNIVGVLNLYSATHAVHATGLSRNFLFQTTCLLGGWIVFIIVTLINYKHLIRFSYLFYIGILIALILVPFIGRSTYGAKRWLDLGLFSFQPSETMKVALILILSHLLIHHRYIQVLKLKDLILPFLVTIVPFVLTLRQPDLGTAMIFLAIALSMILFIGIQKQLFILCVLMGIIAMPLAWNFALKDYQKDRVLTFLYPSKDPQGSGYNSNQSKISIGSGQILGKGFRQGTQSQLRFLPERHTDFIFSVLSEEHGFLGSTATIGLFFLLLLIGINIASKAADKTGALLAIGSITVLFWHISVNIGMVTGLLPIVGIPLPLLSYGGSNLLLTMFTLGLISSVAMNRNLF